MGHDKQVEGGNELREGGGGGVIIVSEFFGNDSAISIATMT